MLQVQWTTALPQNSSKHRRQSPSSTPCTYFCHVLYLIDYSWSSGVFKISDRGLWIRCDSCLVHRIHRIIVCWSSVNSPTLLRNTEGFQHNYYEYSNLLHPEINATAQLKYHISQLIAHKNTYRQVSNISRTLVGNKIIDHSDVDGASPVGAAPTTSSFLTLHLASLE